MSFFHSFIQQAPEGGATHYQQDNEPWKGGYLKLDRQGECVACVVNGEWRQGGGYDEGHTFSLESFDTRNMKVVESLH